MKPLTIFVQRHPLVSYYILTFAISWGGLLALGGFGGISSTAWQSDPRLPFMVVAMLAGPSIAGLLLTGLVAGRAGYRELLSRLLRWRVGVQWYAVALLTAPLVFSAVHAALSLASPIYLPGRLTAASVLAAIVGGVVTGIFEEVGWTGFAIPQLHLRRQGVLATGLFVGMLWGAWHLLTNDIWIGNAFAGELPLAVFLFVTALSLVGGQLLAYRVLMVWVYDRTESLLVAILMHASLTTCTILVTLAPSVVGVAFLTYGFALAAAWWLIVTAVALAHHGHLSRQRTVVQQGALR